MSDLTRAILEMREAEPAYREAHSYHVGDVPEKFGSRRLRRLLKAALDQFKLNAAKTPVNVVADRLEVAAVTVPDSDDLTDALQRDAWDANELTFEMPGVIRGACKFGDYYQLVWENPDDESAVDISSHSPLEGRMLYEPGNSRKKLAYVHVWVEQGTRYADVFYSDRLEQFYQDEKDKPEDEAKWQQRVTLLREPEEGEEFDPAVSITDQLGVWPIPHEYGEVPAFHYRTERPWGVPLHKDAYGPQDAITKLVATHMGTVDYQGFPQRYALEDTQGGDGDSDSDWDDEWDNETPGTSGAPERRLKAGPAEVWWLKSVKSVGQFAVADPKVFTEPAEFYLRMMAQTTDMPLHFFQPGGDQPSGDSRRAAMDTVVKKVNTQKQGLGATAAAMLTFAMVVLGYNMDDKKVDVRWKPAEPQDDKDSWETAKLKTEAGVPTRQVLLEQGYTEAQVDGFLNEDQDRDLRGRVEMLDKIGDAVQKLGSAIGFGILEPEQVQGIITAILTDAEE